MKTMLCRKDEKSIESWLKNLPKNLEAYPKARGNNEREYCKKTIWANILVKAYIRNFLETENLKLSEKIEKPRENQD